MGRGHYHGGGILLGRGIGPIGKRKPRSANLVGGVGPERSAQLAANRRKKCKSDEKANKNAKKLKKFWTKVAVEKARANKIRSAEERTAKSLAIAIERARSTKNQSSFATALRAALIEN